MKGSKYATGDRVAEAQVAEARSSLGKGGSTPRAADGQGAFHAWTIDETLSALSTSEEGLCNDEARARLVREGPNRLTRRGGPSALRKFLAQFGDPLVVVLIVASIVSFALGEVVDALVIFAVVFANAVIGFYQERRAEQAILALDDMITTEATVLRDGERVRLPSEELVRGDVVLLQSGDTVPADLRLIQVRELQVEEAALTGESVPVQKAVDPLPADTFLGDRQNLAFAGTAVTYGQACGVVVATGDHTETGRIAGMLSSVDALVTPLTRRIAALSRLLVWSILAVAAALFAVEALRGSDLVTTFNAAVALAVGAIPEGLPAAVTVLLAVGVSTMAKRNALIRKLPAVETLGSTTVICSDKTGTLTENQMMVTTLVVGGEEYQVSGQGYAPTGSFMRGGKDVVTVGEVVALVECLRAGALCNDTIVRRGPEGVKVEGDPTEAALLVAAEKAGLSEALHAFERVDSVPFESQHMYMATLHRVGERMVAYVKGSSDVLLGRCRAELTGDGREVPCDRARLEAKVEKLAERGLRVLVMAKRELGPDVRTLGHDDIRDLTFVGLVGMVDPPRAAAKSAVAACQGAGIRVKMITGDHARTASAIASELGLEGKRDARGRLVAVTGHELGQLDDHALAEQADDVAVFARVAPEQKLKLVKALQKRGHVVAMTGDGVNDAPALRQADIGVAMGKSGTDVARSAAAMVLTDDDFATIAAAVEEGRGVYDNLVKFMAWTLPTNGGEAMVLFLAVLLRAELPVLPVQLLWINLATAVLLGIALVFEPKEPGLMQRPPRAVNQPLLDGSLLARIVLISALMAVASFTFFKFALARGTSVEAARTIVVNTIVVLEVAYLFACRSLALPFWRIGAFANPYVWYGSVFMLLTQLLFTYAPIMNRLFHTAPIEPFWWLVFSGAGVLVLVLAELIKLFTHRSA